MSFFLFILFIYTFSQSNSTTEITDFGFWQSHRICHPPFNWSIPNGLTHKYKKLFWEQPENMRHFLDTNSSEHCGVVRIIEKGQVHLPFGPFSNETHFINMKSEPRQSINVHCELLLILTGHWGHYFQHFFDNIGPQLSLAIDAIGADLLKNTTLVVDTSTMFPNVPKLWKRFGFRKVIASKLNKNYAAKKLVYVESSPRVHPYYFMHLRKLLKLSDNVTDINNNNFKGRKIIFISRKMTNSYFNQRFILNEDNLISMIYQIYGKKNVIVFDHHKYTMDETIELFSNAKAIIGSHGGGMYNQFFAPKNCVVVEIMPIKPSGLYPDQKFKEEIPTFSHMAVWSNSLLIGQKFYRYYQITHLPNFEINLMKFEKFLSKIPELIDEEL